MHRWTDMTDWGPKGSDRSDTPRFCKPSQPKKLGQGAFKRVYRAYDCIEGNEVAWSEIGIGHLGGSERSKILREVKMMKQLKHENLIELIDQWFDAEDNKVVIITAMGVPLRKFVERWSGAIELSLVRKWAREVLQGLTYIHSQGVVHRDMKMENLLLVKGRVVITDYGLARELASAADKRMTSYIGTPAFMAPELYQDEGYDNKVDVYAFGMVLLEMITAEMPYAECGGAPAKIMFKVMNGAKPSGLRKIRCAAARKLIQACLAKDPNQRPSAQALLQDHSFFHVSDEYLHAASRPFVPVPSETAGAGMSDADSVGTVDSAGTSSNAGAGGNSSNSTGATSPLNSAASAKPTILDRGWLPPVLVYDPLQMELRHQLEQGFKQQQQQQQQQAAQSDGEQGAVSGVGLEPMVDKGDDLGPEFNLRYDSKLEEAALLADAIMKDFHARVDDLARQAKEQVAEQALQKMFNALPRTEGGDNAADAAEIRSQMPSNLRDAWAGVEDQYVSVMLAARDYVNSVPMKLSDALNAGANRSAKICKAHMRNWCVQRALRAVARSLAAQSEFSSNASRRLSTAGDDCTTNSNNNTTTTTNNNNGGVVGGGDSQAGRQMRRIESSNSVTADGWDNIMKTLPYNSTLDADDTEDGSDSPGTAGTADTEDFPTVAESTNRPRTGTADLADTEDVFASVDGGRAAALAADADRDSKNGTPVPSDSDQQDHQVQDEDGRVGRLSVHTASAGLPPRPRPRSTSGSNMPASGTGSDSESPVPGSPHGQGIAAIDTGIGIGGPIVPVASADGLLPARRASLERKDSDPFGFVNANIFGTKVKTTTVAPGERSPAMMLDAGVIAAISPSGKIQVGGGSSASLGSGSSSAGGADFEATTSANTHEHRTLPLGPTGSPQLIEFTPGPPRQQPNGHGRAQSVLGHHDDRDVVSDSELPAPQRRGPGSFNQQLHDDPGHMSDPGLVAHKHKRTPSDPFGGLFIDSPTGSGSGSGSGDADGISPVPRGDTTMDTMHSINLNDDSTVTADFTHDLQDGIHQDDDTSSGSGSHDEDDGADIFELNVEEAARRLKLK